VAFFQTILFDLDGTLVDSAPDVRACTNEALAAEGRRELSLGEIKSLIGQGARVLVERALALTGDAGTAEMVDECLERFIATYRAHPVRHTQVYPGVLEVLDRFRGLGITMGICTNKPQATTGPVIDAFGLDPYFGTICCGDAVPHRKPDGRHVFHTLEILGADAASAVLVGDSENDIGAALNAGIPSVAVSFGYSHQPPHELGADAVIDAFADLPDALARILAQREA